MRTIRIHLDEPLAAGATVELPPAAADHVARVLRLGVGATVRLFNGDGHDYAGHITAVGKRSVSVALEGAQAVDTESSLQLVLAQGLARGEKMDLIVQKATELGVAAIVPLLTERSEVKLDAARTQKRLAHWQAVVASACEQCGRARLPVIEPPVPLASWLGGLDAAAGLRLALLPQGTRVVRELPLATAGRVLLVVGPEGGLGDRDVQALQSARFEGLRLGPRILRTETAGLAALAALQATYGDW